MAGFIRNIKNPFTGNYVFPVTKIRAVYDDNGNRLDYHLEEIKRRLDELEAKVESK